jgi:hypothetical protein
MKDRVTFRAGIISFGQAAGNANTLREPNGSLRSATPNKGDATVSDDRMTCNQVVHGLVLAGSKDSNGFHPD